MPKWLLERYTDIYIHDCETVTDNIRNKVKYTLENKMNNTVQKNKAKYNIEYLLYEGL